MQFIEHRVRRHTRIRAFGTLATFLASLLAPLTVFAAKQDAKFELHPHCVKNEAGDDNWIFGPIPSPGMVLETREGGVRCTSFEVEDPQTLRTPALRKGDVLDIDLVIDNPGKQDIRRVRAWLSYDPNMLEGTLLEINDAFTLVTPDEKGFSESEGYAKTEASTEGNGVGDEKIIFARLQFTIKETNTIGTPITFHDTQPGGHSVIMAVEGGSEAYIVKEEPGVLLVTFVPEDIPEPEPVATEENDGRSSDNIENIFDAFPQAKTIGSDATEEDIVDPEVPEEEEEEDTNTCLRDADCGGGVCLAGECRERPAKVPNGASCSVDPDCESGLCGSGVCVPSLSDSEQGNLDANATETRTAFSLLQIRNVRVTTDGSSVFLAWDDLRSSQLKAYSIYYGTTSGRYIQRRTIDKSETSITLRSLPLETRYFFAVRGLSTRDEESAFSQEVSIIVGDPDSSTAPLEAGAITDSPGRNPVGSILDDGDGKDVPGETGAPSALLLFFLGCAIVGTAFASRRQISIASGPHE